MLKPPTDDPYTALKEQLTKRTALSEQLRLQQFTCVELGDRKLTKLLCNMQQLLGGCPSIDPSFLKELFLKRLPQNVRMVLASTPEGTTLSILAEMADKVIEVAAPSGSVAALNMHSSDNPPTLPASHAPLPATAADIEDLPSEISRLEKLVRNLARSRSSSRPTRSSHRSTTPTPTSDMPDNALCWYHQKFGDGACGCRSPCSWASNEQAGR